MTEDVQFIEVWGIEAPMCAYCGEAFLKQETEHVIACPNCGAGYQWRNNEWIPFKPKAERWKMTLDLLNGKDDS